MSHPLLSQVAEALQTLFVTRADTLGRETGFIQRKREFSGATFVQTLVFGTLSAPETSVTDFLHAAATCGVYVRSQSLEDRFTESAAMFLQRMLEEAVQTAVAAEPVLLPILQRFTGVFLLDSTTVRLPDELVTLRAGRNSSNAVKLQVRWDLLTGQLDGPLLQPERQHDRASTFQSQSLPQGSLRLADTGFFALDRLAAMDRDGCFWLTRIPAQTLVGKDGQWFALPTFLARYGPAREGESWETEILLGKKKRLPCRFLALRVSEEVAAKRRKCLESQAKRRGKRLQKGQKLRTSWTFYVTNAPRMRMSVEEAWVLARLRWQVELLFKLWKSQVRLDESRSQKPWRVLCEFLAKLLAVLIQHWIQVTTAWHLPDRSLTKLASLIRKQTLHLAGLLKSLDALIAFLAALKPVAETACRLQRRKDKPNHAQCLEAIP